EGMVFASPEEVETAYLNKAAALHAKIKVRLPEEEGRRVVETTVGRVIFSSALPKSVGYFDEELGFHRETLSKKNLGHLIAVAHSRCPPRECAAVLDAIKDMGFFYARAGGLSICVDDMQIP